MPTLDLHKRLYSVGRRLYFGDEGRFMVNTGLLSTHLSYVPEQDVRAVSRAATLAELACFVPGAVALFGWIERWWSPWWFAAAVVVSFVGPSFVLRRLRERYEPVLNDAVLRDVRKRAAFAAQPVGAVGAMFTLILAQWSSLIVRHHWRWPVLGIVALVFGLQFAQSIHYARERKAIGDNGS